MLEKISRQPMLSPSMKPDALSYQCPFCDRQVRVGRNCPGCAGKQRQRRQPKPRKPWQQDESADGIDLPDDDFDYDEFVAREFGHLPHRKSGLKWYWWLLAIIVLAGMITTFVW
ncbi:MAG: hypothetical protein ACQCXQ_05625 [Verrucomicrobiales bacterium]